MKMNANIFVTDIVGYSKITGNDQKLALELLKEHDNIIEPIIKRYNGVIVKRIGDAIIATYDCSTEMIQSSIEIQQNLKNRNNRNTKNRHLILRIGLHYGEVIIQNDELYGYGYSIAENIEPICNPGGISISNQLYKQVHNHNNLIIKGIKNHFYIRPVAHFTFKNINEPILIYNLYLNLLDWYEDIFDRTYLYLAKEGIPEHLYTPYNQYHKFSFKKSFSIANNFYKNHNLSCAVYHYKMCIDYGNGSNKDSINLLILKIFSECGLYRLVNRAMNQLNINNNNLSTLIKGINLFNDKEEDEATKLFQKSLNNKIDESNIEAIYYLIIIYHNDDKQKIINLINSLFSKINSPTHIKILILINDILKSNIEDIETIYNQFEIKNLYEVIHHKFLLFVYLVIIQLYVNNKELDKAIIFQNKARVSIGFLSDKIFGFLLKKLFYNNPLLHKKIIELIDIDFIEEVEGLDELDVDIDHLLASKKIIYQFCTKCGSKNKNKNKFCIGCGASLI